MSTRLSLFDSPLLLGFDHFERTLDRIAKSGGGGYPPYNIEQIGENSLRITLAVAGFTSDDLSVTIEDRQLMIRGKQNNEDTDADGQERVFLHRGIATRQFQRVFVLADGIEVQGSSLDNGLLHIDMNRIIPNNNVRTIHIDSKRNEGQPKTVEAKALTHDPDPSDKKN